MVIAVAMASMAKANDDSNGHNDDCLLNGERKGRGTCW